MKTLLTKLSKILLSIHSLRKKSDNVFAGQKFPNGGLPEMRDAPML